MPIRTKSLGLQDVKSWDAYITSCHMGTVYHLSGWKNIIEKTYGHKTYYFMAVNSSKLPDGVNTTAFHRAGKAQRRIPPLPISQYPVSNSDN